MQNMTGRRVWIGPDLFDWAAQHPRRRARRGWTGATANAVNAVRGSNAEFIEAALGLFTAEILGDAEFVADAVTAAAIERGIRPQTTWRAIGPLMTMAVSQGLVVKTGNMLPRNQAPNGHTTNHLGPAYRLAVRTK